MEQKLKRTLSNVVEEYDFSDDVKIRPRTKSNKKNKWYRQLGYQVASISLLLGVVFAISPEVRSMTEKWTNQVFHIDISSEEDIEIRDGYVFVDGIKTISEEQYKLGFYSPVYADDGYILEETHNKDFTLRNLTEKNLGKKFKTTTQAMTKIDYVIKQPTSLPKDLSLDSVYVKGQRVDIAFNTDSNKDLFISVQERSNMEGYTVLDDVQGINIGEKSKLGKRPHKFWDSGNNKPAVKAEYVLTFIDDGIQYELFGTNLTKDEMITIAKSIE